MSKPAIDARDLPAELRERLGIVDPRQGKRSNKSRSMTKNDVRTAAIRILAVIADLTPAERARVLSHAAKVNKL